MRIMNRTDEQLIIEYLEGDEQALGFLVDRYLKDVYRFVYQLTKDGGMAEDVTQESFVKAWKKIRSFRQGSNFKTWLFAIARNTAIDWLRKHKEVQLSSFENIQGRNMLLESTAGIELLPSELLERAENTAYVTSLLEQLDPKYREVLTLRHSSNMTFEEIGEMLRRPLHTVKSQHRRALVMLRRLREAEPA
jgi:RNA polymerase sigma-70 factor, ECF subfamily